MNKTLKIDATSAIKMDMSHFEFIFSFENLKNSNLNPNLIAVPTPNCTKTSLRWDLSAKMNRELGSNFQEQKKQLICRTIINIRLCKLCFSSCHIFQLLVYLLFRRNGLGQFLYQFFSKLVSVRNWIHYYIILFGK